MVELKGSEKQIAWATDIRNNLLEVISTLKSFQEKAGTKIPEKEIALENKEIEDIKECFKRGNDLEVVYNNRESIYYSNINGSWGFPKKFI